MIKQTGKKNALPLIDALYINNSGGIMLLDYLVKKLNQCNTEFILLADSRCLGRFDSYNNVYYMSASMWDRRLFYKKHSELFSSVLCFGNIPAPIKLNIPVYTYFHNINLLTLSEAYSLKEKSIMWLKREVFRHYKNNTDFWLVQTSNTANELSKHLSEPKEKVKILPFYELPLKLRQLKNINHGGDYVYVSNYTGAKGHEELLEAWKILHRRGIDRTLHLTVPYTVELFCKKIENAQKDGVKIVNHGLIPFENVIELYKKSKSIIYPSHNESLGLGLIESIEAGCDVIASDLPFIHSICVPTLVFNPYLPESIADSITKYENETCQKPELLIYNHIDELVQLLSNNL